MSATVYEIFDQIQQLPVDDRNILDRLLQKLEEKEWQAETRKARRRADKQGLDQQAIDRAVELERYGG